MRAFLIALFLLLGVAPGAIAQTAPAQLEGQITC
jgi:hypothetical protein